jgi:hypothetical protein
VSTSPSYFDNARRSLATTFNRRRGFAQFSCRRSQRTDVGASDGHRHQQHASRERRAAQGPDRAAGAQPLQHTPFPPLHEKILPVLTAAAASTWIRLIARRAQRRPGTAKTQHMLADAIWLIDTPLFATLAPLSSQRSGIRHWLDTHRETVFSRRPHSSRLRRRSRPSPPICDAAPRR